MTRGWSMLVGSQSVHTLTPRRTHTSLRLTAVDTQSRSSRYATWHFYVECSSFSIYLHRVSEFVDLQDSLFGCTDKHKQMLLSVVWKYR